MVAGFLIEFLSIDWRHGRVVQVDPIKPMLQAPEFRRLKLNYDEPFWIFAFNFNLRHYSTASCGSTTTWWTLTWRFRQGEH